MNSVYIIGKVSGLDREYVEKKFANVEEHLTKHFKTVVNPTKLVPADTDWETAMKMCIKSMLDCDAVYVMNDVSSSVGGLLELHIARALKMPLYLEGDV